MAKGKYWNGSEWEVLGTDASKVTEEVDKRFMTDAERTKLSGIAAGAQVNVGTNIAQGTRTTTAVPITSSTGTGATLSAATTTLAGVMTAADKTKLDGIATGATANTGTVTSVSAGNGLNFTTITGTGTVTLGTPSTITNATTNSTTATSHTHALTVTKTDVSLGNVDNVKQMPIAGGTFTGEAKAQNNTAYTTAQLRNAILSTADPSGGGNGDIWLKYKP